MIIKLHQITEMHNNDFVYFYLIKNKNNVYLKTMKKIICEFYLKYYHSGNFLKQVYIKNLEINYTGKISVNDYFVSPFEYFEI